MNTALNEPVPADSPMQSEIQLHLRERVSETLNDCEAAKSLFNLLLAGGGFRNDGRRRRALERALAQLVKANEGHIVALAALADFLIDGTLSSPSLATFPQARLS